MAPTKNAPRSARRKRRSTEVFIGASSQSWETVERPLRKSEMGNRRKRRADERRERFTLLYAPIFHFDAQAKKKTPGFFDFARNFSSRRRKLAATNAWERKLEPPSMKKRRRSNREDSDDGVSTSRAAPLGSNVSAQRERKPNSSVARAGVGSSALVGRKSQATTERRNRIRAVARAGSGAVAADYSAGTSGVSVSSASVATGA